MNNTNVRPAEGAGIARFAREPATVVSVRNAPERGAVRIAREPAVKFTSQLAERSLSNLLSFGVKDASQFFGDTMPERAPKDPERQQSSKER